MTEDANLFYKINGSNLNNKMDNNKNIIIALII